MVDIRTCVELSNGVMANCFCGNQLAFAVDNVENKYGYFLKYPSLQEIVSDDDKAKEVLTYCGLYDLKAKDILNGDIMLTYGTICSGVTKKEIQDLFDEIGAILTKDISQEEEELFNIAYKNLSCILYATTI